LHRAIAVRAERHAFSNVDRYVFAEGLWNVWGRVTDEFTHPRGDSGEALRLAAEAAAALSEALGDEARERDYCDVWIYQRLDIA
jgi:hypothetical protein